MNSKEDIIAQVRKNGLWIIARLALSNTYHVRASDILDVDEDRGIITIGYPVKESRVFLDVANVGKNWFLTLADAEEAIKKRR